MVTTYTISVLGREKGSMVEYTPLPEEVPEDEARGNSFCSYHSEALHHM